MSNDSSTGISRHFAPLVSGVLLLAVGPAQGADVVLEVTGTIQVINYVGGDFSASVFGAPLTNGQLVKVRFTYPDNLTDTFNGSAPNQARYQIHLGPLGGRVSVVANGLEAVAEIDQNSYCVIDTANDVRPNPFEDRFHDVLQAACDVPTEGAGMISGSLVLGSQGTAAQLPTGMTSIALPTNATFDPTQFTDFRSAGFYLQSTDGTKLVSAGMSIASVVARPAPTTAEAVTELAQAVVAINVDAGIASSLDAKLDNVIAALDESRKGNAASAANLLRAFISAVEAQRGKKLTNAQASALVSAANQLIDRVSSP